MPVKTLKNFLDLNRVKYVSIIHSPAYTAQEVAQSVHLPGREMAKVVIIKLNDQMAMAVLPATSKVVVPDLRELTSCENVALALESEFKSRFPDCEVGAMPPFGNLYGMEVYASEDLALNREIAFNAGSHVEVIRMNYDDFERLVKPKVLAFTN